MPAWIHSQSVPLPSSTTISHGQVRDFIAMLNPWLLEYNDAIMSVPCIPSDHCGSDP